MGRVHVQQDWARSRHMFELNISQRASELYRVQLVSLQLINSLHLEMYFRKASGHAEKVVALHKFRKDEVHCRSRFGSISATSAKGRQTEATYAHCCMGDRSRHIRKQIHDKWQQNLQWNFVDWDKSCLWVLFFCLFCASYLVISTHLESKQPAHPKPVKTAQLSFIYLFFLKLNNWGRLSWTNKYGSLAAEISSWSNNTGQFHLPVGAWAANERGGIVLPGCVYLRFLTSLCIVIPIYQLLWPPWLCEHGPCVYNSHRSEHLTGGFLWFLINILSFWKEKTESNWMNSMLSS